MKQTEYALLVAGATFAGIGAAAAASEANRSVVVVERTALVGSEFIDAMNPGRGTGTPETDFGRSFRDEAANRNVMTEAGLLHLPALHPVLCLRIKQYGVNVRFLTEIVEVARCGGRYVVTLSDAAGLHRVTTDEMLDTSTRRLTEPGNLFVPVHKRLNAYLHHPDIGAAPLPEPIDGAMSIARGRFPSEVILRVCVPPKLDWLQAKQWLYRYWEARPEAWAPWTIAAVAGGFESIVRRGPRRLKEGWTWLPSEAYDHPIEAIDAGYGHMVYAGGVRDETAL
ncbi:hypothetical protein [Paenibacillus sp.]|uniref:hypothetical protein n=1 Tax=Paenibacillus sp. TaxID=58172 RepID=UPI0028123E45|nr:hypothetical protein [Paenibacillus sp.]